MEDLSGALIQRKSRNRTSLRKLKQLYGSSDKLEVLLTRYYSFVERELSGFNSVSTISQDWSPPSQSGHKVLIRDMPSDLLKCRAAIRSLSDKQASVIRLRYDWFRHDDTNLLVVNSERAEAAGLSESEFKNLLQSAKRKLRRYLQL